MPIDCNVGRTLPPRGPAHDARTARASRRLRRAAARDPSTVPEGSSQTRSQGPNEDLETRSLPARRGSRAHDARRADDRGRDRLRARPDGLRVPGERPPTAPARPLHARARHPDPPPHRALVRPAVVTAQPRMR